MRQSNGFIKEKNVFLGPQHQVSAGFFCAVLGVLCAMSFSLGQEGYAGLSDAPASATSYLWSALAAVFGWLFWQVYALRRLRPSLPAVCFGLLFGVLNRLGVTLFAYDTWRFLDDPIRLAVTVLCCAGQGSLMTTAITIIDEVLRSGKLTKRKAESETRSAEDAGALRLLHRLKRQYDVHTTQFCMALLFVCWLPYLVVFFPGTMSWDIGEMLAQFFGQREMDTWHPVFLTWVVGACMWAGRQIGSDNLGAALFMLLQTAALAYALGYAVSSVRRMGGRRRVQAVALCFFGIVPIWGGYAQFICKDTLYVALLLVFVLKTMTLLMDGEALTAKWLCGYGGAALGACLVRHNGVYVVLPTAILTVLFAVRGKQRLRIGGTLGGALALVFLFSGMLLPALGIRDETASGMYSVMFQQSARVLREHGDAVTPDEYAEIDLILDAANLPALYEPWISDPVKYTFKAYGQGAAAEREALQRYQKTWFSMLMKYPITYLEAFVAGNSAYYAFTPKMEGETYNNQAGNRFVFETHPQVATNLGIHTERISPLERAGQLLAVAVRGGRHIPIFALLYCCAVYTWLLVAAGISVARQGRLKCLVAFVPALLSLATCMLSPVNDYFRYYLPIVAMALPLLLMADAGCEGGAAKAEDGTP